MSKEKNDKNMTIIMFCAFYFIFILVQFGFLMLFNYILIDAQKMKIIDSPFLRESRNIFSIFTLKSFWLAVLTLFIGQLINGAIDYFTKNKDLTLNQLMYTPKNRVILQQIVVIVGGIFLGSIQSPIAFLIVLVTAKIFMDIIDLLKKEKKS